MVTPTIFIICCWIVSTSLGKTAPNIIFILADDLGYDDLGYQSECHQISTPNIDFFYKNGRQLEWHYVQMVCSPTRASLMTGRYPLHTSINKGVTGSWGVPLYFDMLPKMLKQKANYSTHAIGKWHLGYYEWEYTPTFRGFDTFLGFYGGSEYFYNHTDRGYDFRNDTLPNCGSNCSIVADEYYGEYATFIYAQTAQDIIKNHDKTNPLFLYLPFQNVHYPCECPQQYIDEYNTTIHNATRRLFAGKLSVLDEAIGNITNTLRLYNYLNNNTIIVFSSDNGAPIHSAGCGGSNYPLRGEKGTVFEGGVHSTAAFWASDDLLDNQNLRGEKYTQLMHIVDWYSTFLFAAGIDVNNASNNVNTTNLDSINHWNGLIGKYNGNDPYFGIRENVYLGFEIQLKNVSYRKGWLKIFNGTCTQWNGWYPPPTITQPISSERFQVGIENVMVADHIPMYNLSNDPNEYYDINNSTEMNNIAMNIYNEMLKLQATGILNARADAKCPTVNISGCPIDPVLHYRVNCPYCNATSSWLSKTDIYQ